MSQTVGQLPELAETRPESPDTPGLHTPHRRRPRPSNTRCPPPPGRPSRQLCPCPEVTDVSTSGRRSRSTPQAVGQSPAELSGELLTICPTRRCWIEKPSCPTL